MIKMTWKDILKAVSEDMTPEAEDAADEMIGILMNGIDIIGEEQRHYEGPGYGYDGLGFIYTGDTMFGRVSFAAHLDGSVSEEGYNTKFTKESARAYNKKLRAEQKREYDNYKNYPQEPRFETPDDYYY